MTDRLWPFKVYKHLKYTSSKTLIELSWHPVTSLGGLSTIHMTITLSLCLILMVVCISNVPDNRLEGDNIRKFNLKIKKT